MKLKSALMPLLIGGLAYGLFFFGSGFFPNFQLHEISILPVLMYTAVAVGLYLNVSDIEMEELLRNKGVIAAVLLIGVPAKIFLPGLALLLLVPSLGKATVFLCATVIAQIDPILSAKSIAHDRFSQKSGTILRCWSSFDDPITVLFAFYIFLPLFFQDQSFLIGRYFIQLLGELIVCAVLAFCLNVFLNSQSRLAGLKERHIKRFVVISTCIASGVLGRFLLPASLGLLVDPFSAQAKQRVLNWIFVFTSFVIGALAVDVRISWFPGIVLGAATFFLAQPLVSLLFIRDSRDNLWRVMLGHQNGMTAILLTVAIELQIGNLQLLSITLPAIIAIALFYPSANYLLERYYPQPATALPIADSAQRKPVDVNRR